MVSLLDGEEPLLLAAGVGVAVGVLPAGTFLCDEVAD
jgi:hypothetical protein